VTWFDFSWQNFWFSFLALIFEGIPFVLVGSLISGFGLGIGLFLLVGILCESLVILMYASQGF
jgi:hypothetical protein